MKRKVTTTASMAIVAMSTGLASIASAHSELHRHATIEGVAYLSVSGPPRLGSHTRPEGGIKVTFKNTGGRGPTVTRTTSADGRFAVGVAPGVYAVVAQVGEPVTNRTHVCGKPKRVTASQGGVLRLRIVCNAR
jgi:hypothetical protein